MFKVTAQMANEVATLLGTTDKNLVFSAIIKTLIGEGFTIQQAYEALFGEGSYGALVGMVRDELRLAA